MDLKTVAIVLLGLWAFKRFGHAHEVARRQVEIVPADPYIGLGTIWDAIDGGAYDYNAHAPLVATVAGGQTQASACICR